MGGDHANDMCRQGFSGTGINRSAVITESRMCAANHDIHL